MKKPPFTNYEMLVIFETANQALADANIFDDIAEKLDIADDKMVKVKEKLGKFLDDQQ